MFLFSYYDFFSFSFFVFNYKHILVYIRDRHLMEQVSRYQLNFSFSELFSCLLIWDNYGLSLPYLLFFTS
jgi:hypothetical protein